MPTRKLVESFNYAIEGFIYTLKTQRNMRIHFLTGAFVFLLGVVMDFSKIELVCLGLAISLVLFAEMINTAIERMIDLVSRSVHPSARIVKDIAAGAVLLAALTSVIVGYLLFLGHLNFSLVRGFSRIKEMPSHITVIVLIVVLFLVIFGKVLFHKGTPLRGGMPSGHAAIALSFWAIIIFSTQNLLIVALTFILAFLVSISRFSQKIHTISEVIAGALLGFLATLFILQIFN